MSEYSAPGHSSTPGGPATVLVTGGAGFIGTHVCRTLLQAGLRPRVLDLVLPPVPVLGVEYVRADVRELDAVQTLTRGVAGVVHLAARVSVPLCEAEPEESARTNVGGSERVIEAVRRERERGGWDVPLVFASSAAVYGRPSRESPVHEDDPTRPLSVYGEQKLRVEALLATAAERDGLRAVPLRFFNVFGAGQDPLSPYSGVMTVFATRLARGEPIGLDGGGKAVRDFVAVEDTALAVVQTLRALGLGGRPATGSLRPAQPINIGSGRATSIRELALLMGASESRLEPRPEREGDIPWSCADVTRAAEWLGWRASTPLEQGIRRLLG